MFVMITHDKTKVWKKRTAIICLLSSNPAFVFLCVCLFERERQRSWVWVCDNVYPTPKYEPIKRINEKETAFSKAEKASGKLVNPKVLIQL